MIKEAFEEFGFENFKVDLIEKCYSDKELIDKEIYWINYYNAVEDKNFYNMRDGGYPGNPKGIKFSEDFKRKISESRKLFYKNNPEKKLFGEKNGMYNKHHSLETRRKISASCKGKNAGENNWIYHNGDAFKGDKNPFYGKKHTKEFGDIIRESNKKRIRTEVYEQKWNK